LSMETPKRIEAGFQAKYSIGFKVSIAAELMPIFPTRNWVGSRLFGRLLGASFAASGILADSVSCVGELNSMMGVAGVSDLAEGIAGVKALMKEFGCHPFQIAYWSEDECLWRLVHPRAEVIQVGEFITAEAINEDSARYTRICEKIMAELWVKNGRREGAE
jgi:hypothetical protein